MCLRMDDTLGGASDGEPALLESETDNVILESMSIITIDVNKPTARPQLPPGSPNTPVPPDGLCLYHCCEAVKNIATWMR